MCIVGNPIVMNCLQGYNGTIFAYGQTGSGKTYTIQGPKDYDSNCEEKGLIFRCVENLFKHLDQQKDSDNVEYKVMCVYIEIYNDEILDLLDPASNHLKLREKNHEVYLENVTEKYVTNSRDIYEIMKQGTANRHVSATNMNKYSSRSHAILTLKIEQEKEIDIGKSFITSEFHIVDLAGSERQRKTLTMNKALGEACNINQSLLILSRIINALVEQGKGKSCHIPYRDSILTHYLRNSLGGNSKTLIIANISPSSSSYQETNSTLRFAQRAKLIENRAIINENTAENIEQLKLVIKELEAEISILKAEKCSKELNGNENVTHTYLSPVSASRKRKGANFSRKSDFKIYHDGKVFASPSGFSEISNLNAENAEANHYLCERIIKLEKLLVLYKEQCHKTTDYYYAELNKLENNNLQYKSALAKYKEMHEVDLKTIETQQKLLDKVGFESEVDIQ